MRVGRRKHFDKDVAKIVAQADAMNEREAEIHAMFVRGYVPIEVAIELIRAYDLDVPGGGAPASDAELRSEVDRRVRLFAASMR